MKVNWLSWLALLLAAAALIISFVYIGQARYISTEAQATIDAFNNATDQLIAVLDEYDRVIDEYNRISDSYNEAAEEYNQIVEDYWEWRAEQNDT